MCGIVGLIAERKQGFFKQDMDVFGDLLLANQLRGMHGTGMFRVDKDSDYVDWLKIGDHASRFKNLKEYFPFIEQAYKEGQVIIGHNRYATTGSIDTNSAHPFTHKNITLVHNGRIYNTNEKKNGVSVDSESFTIDLANSEDDFKSVISDIKGAAALVWYNKKTKLLHMYRNEERPLSLFKTPFGWVLASEMDMGTWILGRTKTTVTEKRSLIPGTLYTVDLKDDQRKLTEEKLERKSTTVYYGSASQPYYGFQQSRIITPSVTSKVRVGDVILFSYTNSSFITLNDLEYTHEGILEDDDDNAISARVFFKSKTKLSEEFKDAPFLRGTVVSVINKGGGDFSYQVKARSVAIAEVLETPNAQNDDVFSTDVKLKCGTRILGENLKKYINMGCTSCRASLDIKNASEYVFSNANAGLICDTCVHEIANSGAAYGFDGISSFNGRLFPIGVAE